MSNTFVAIAGNVVEGLVLYGPFATAAAAQAFKPQTEEGEPLADELLEPEEYEGEPVPAGELAAAVITGDPVSGLFFYGPFASLNDAGDWAGIHHEGQDWWTTVLNPPPQEG